MKKWSWKRLRLNQGADMPEDRLMLLNLYITQALTLVIALLIFLFQRSNPLRPLSIPEPTDVLYWGIGFAACVLLGDFILSRWVPEDVSDDGGINQLLFGQRALWHIAVLSAIVAICEELLFRGAIQHAFGPYWTSILFAAIHIRYLRHWLMTGMVFGISYGLGWIYLHTGSLWTPIAAHFVIDLVMGCMIRFRRPQERE